MRVASALLENWNPAMQLGFPHKGWENEHLATFLLSRIAFVATPITVGDDIGTDIFCTLFETGKHKGQPVLLPRRLDLTRLSGHLNGLDGSSRREVDHGTEAASV
jgi:hypothetical protein